MSRGLDCRVAYVMLRGVDEVETLLDEIERDSLVALEHDALAEQARQRVRAKLPLARAKDVGPAELERRTHQLWTATTISRWTAAFAPESTVRRGRRKRSGGAVPAPPTAP